jgi:hypothetical protein
VKCQRLASQLAAQQEALEQLRVEHQALIAEAAAQQADLREENERMSEKMDASYRSNASSRSRGGEGDVPHHQQHKASAAVSSASGEKAEADTGTGTGAVVPPPQTAPATTATSSSSLSERVKDLETALRVKDAMLDDQATELTELRAKWHAQSAEFKECRRDYGDLELRYEDALRDVEELQRAKRSLKAELAAVEAELVAQQEREEREVQEVQEVQEELLTLREAVAASAETERKLVALIHGFQSGMDVDDISEILPVSVPGGAGVAAAGVGGLGRLGGVGVKGRKMETTNNKGNISDSDMFTTGGADITGRSFLATPDRKGPWKGGDAGGDSSSSSERKGALSQSYAALQQQYAQVTEEVKRLRAEKAEYERLFLAKNEECSKFAQSLVRTTLLVVLDILVYFCILLCSLFLIFMYCHFLCSYPDKFRAKINQFGVKY